MTRDQIDERLLKDGRGQLIKWICSIMSINELPMYQRFSALKNIFEFFIEFITIQVIACSEILGGNTLQLDGIGSQQGPH